MSAEVQYSVCVWEPEYPDYVERTSALDYYGQEKFRTQSAAMEAAYFLMGAEADDAIVWIEVRSIPEYGPLP